MRNKFRTSMLAVSLGLASIAAQAAIPAYRDLFVFGDSYCDVGNIYVATGGLEPAYPYFSGRYSNGLLWVDYVAGYLGVPLTPYLKGGTDYAFGGAWATQPVVTPQGTIPSVPQQVELYLAQHKGQADPHALYVLEGGGNDILGTTSGTPQALGFDIAASLAESEVLLRQAGAKHFLIPNFFNVGLMPAAAANASFAAAASAAANQFLDQWLAPDEALPGIQILRVDVNSLVNAVAKDPNHIGFKNVSTPCLTTKVCSDPDHTLFWDPEHLTAFAQGDFAVAVETVLAQQPTQPAP